MSKTILLGVAVQHSRKAPRIGFTFFGFYFIFYGAYYFSKLDNSLPELLFRGSFILVGLAYIIYAQIAFSKSSKFAPRISINDNTIEYKLGFFKKSFRISWADIQSIEFAPYRVLYKINDKIETLSYDTNAEVSIEIKETLREFAEAKKIEVIGG
jgi:hypothetical protein